MVGAQGGARYGVATAVVVNLHPVMCKGLPHALSHGMSTTAQHVYFHPHFITREMKLSDVKEFVQGYSL